MSNIEKIGEIFSESTEEHKEILLGVRVALCLSNEEVPITWIGGKAYDYETTCEILDVDMNDCVDGVCKL